MLESPTGCKLFDVGSCCWSTQLLFRISNISHWKIEASSFVFRAYGWRVRLFLVINIPDPVALDSPVLMRDPSVYILISWSGIYLIMFSISLWLKGFMLKLFLIVVFGIMSILSTSLRNLRSLLMHCV